MSERKKISDLFKDNEFKLQEQPSGRAWRLLEDKLEQRRKRHRLQVFKQYAAAAGLALLVALVGLLSWISNQPAPQALAENAKIEIPLEDLPQSTEVEPLTRQVAALSRQYEQSPQIEEGQAVQKIVPRPVASTPPIQQPASR